MGLVSDGGFAWDPSLYEGSAAYYTRGRMSYPPRVAEVLTDRLGLAGSGRLLDIGCGPGSLTLLLSDRFAETVGIDADAAMVAEASRRAAELGVGNAVWRTMRAEDLPADLGRFRVVTLAQSFHWMDQPRVATTVREMLDPDGAWVHVGATTHEGVATDVETAWPRPPRVAIQDLVTRYLGPVRRAGRSALASGHPPCGEDDVMRAAGYTGPERVDVGGGTVVERSADDILASVFSLSSSAPHLFGERLEVFEGELRAMLHSASPEGMFCEVTREVSLAIWRP